MKDRDIDFINDVNKGKKLIPSMFFTMIYVSPIMLVKGFTEVLPSLFGTLYLVIGIGLILYNIIGSTYYTWLVLYVLPKETRRISKELNDYSEQMRELNKPNPNNKERNQKRKEKKRKQRRM